MIKKKENQKAKKQKEISHCQHCQTLFIPEASGAESILCKNCIFKAEEAYSTIQQALQKTTKNKTIESLAQATQCHKALIHGLYLDGRLKVEFENNVTKPSQTHKNRNNTEMIQALKNSIKQKPIKSLF